MPALHELHELPALPASPALHDMHDMHDMHGSPAGAPTAIGEELSVGEAAAALSVDPSTIRRWAAAGKIDSRRVRGPHGAELRLCAAAVAACRLVEGVAASGEAERPCKTGKAGETGETGNASEASEAGKAGEAASLLAAELQARLVARERELEEARELADWLRRQVEQSRQAESELRVLLLEQARALQAVTEPKVLPPAGDPPRRRWWRAWWRG